MLEFFLKIFATDFMPHIYCLRRDPAVVWLEVISDLAIAAAYFAIPLLLFDVVRKRPDPRFRKIALLFVLFIAACGTTHVLAVWTLWHPMYRLEGVAKAVTALASVATATVLLRLRSFLTLLPAPSDLKAEHAMRQQAEVGVHVQEERFRNFVESVEDYAIYMLDPDGLVLSWNLGAERMKGYTAEEITGQSFERFFLPEDRAAAKPKEALRIAAETGRFQAEDWRLRKDGSRFLAKVVIHPVKSKDGALFGFSKVTQNLTATREMAAKYQTLLDGTPDAIVIVNQEGRILFVNKQMEELYGHSRVDVLGRSSEMLVPERLRHERKAYRSQLFERGGSALAARQPETVGLRKDGTEFPLEYTVSPLDVAEGWVLLCAIRDLTDRQRREARFQTLLESAPDAMVIVNPDSLIEMVNRQAEKMFGYNRGEMLGQPVEMLMPVSLRGIHLFHRSAFGKHPSRREMGVDIDLMALRKDGVEFPIEISLSPLEDPAGMSVTAAIRDVTERKLVMKQLAEKAEQLLQSNVALEQFAHFASHDLQEPLRMVASYTQLLAKRYKGKLDKDADEFIGYAVDGTRRMKRMIEDLLDYSRVGKQEIAPTDTSAENAFHEALSNLRGVIEASGAQVACDPLPRVKAVFASLQSVFQNLLGNAIKYAGDHPPRIHIFVHSTGDLWRFSVADNGIGIDPVHSERIFQLFQRLHGREREGTGIGLAICKRLVAQWGGKIWVEAGKGHGANQVSDQSPAVDSEQGSIFHFTIPKGENV